MMKKECCCVGNGNNIKTNWTNIVLTLYQYSMSNWSHWLIDWLIRSDAFISTFGPSLSAETALPWSNLVWVGQITVVSIGGRQWPNAQWWITWQIYRMSSGSGHSTIHWRLLLSIEMFVPFTVDIDNAFHIEIIHIIYVNLWPFELWSNVCV